MGEGRAPASDQLLDRFPLLRQANWLLLQARIGLYGAETWIRDAEEMMRRTRKG